jgi:alpha-mannosidase
MKFEEACVLLPCHSLEDFPTHYEGAAAEGLLAAWSALWHPELLAACGRLPTWYRADGPPDALSGRLIVIPSTSEPLLLAGWASRATSEGAHVVRKIKRRDEIVAAALGGLDNRQENLDPELTADFLALGYGYLAVELLTRQMRYMSNIDEVHLQNEAIAAARACLAGDVEATRRHLQNSFEVLVEARERFYPVDAFLVDLTLVAPTTVGESLRRQFASDVPQNLLIAGDTLAHLAHAAPETLAALRMALDHGTVTLVGGERTERELPLLPIEETLDEFHAGAKIFEDLVGHAPRVYGRRRFGLSPLLPQILSRLGFIGAVHATLDDGRFATASQSKVRWEGLDYSAIDALVRLPLDASRADTFLGLPRTLGESMDRDHVATIVFAHWPSQADTFYGDLRRMAAYGAVLGKFITLDDYFANTTSPGELIKFKADGYRAPYLRQAVAQHESSPISGLVGKHLQQARQSATNTLHILADMVGAPPGEAHEGPSLSSDVPLDELDRRQIAAGRRLAGALAPRGTDATGLLLVNSQSFARRSLVDVTELAALPAVEGSVIAAQESAGRRFVVADTPGMGFCWLAPGGPTAPPKKGTKPIVQDNSLSNEFLRVEISPASGGVQAIYDLAQRGNRLASQLAFRTPGPQPKPGDIWRDPDEGAEYAEMKADTVETTHNGAALGEIKSRGQLIDRQGKTLARFEQRYQLARGARVLVVDTDLELDQPVMGDPWESYYAVRFAWPDIAAELYRDVGGVRQLTEAKRLEAPNYLEIGTTRSRTTILTGGLPYHRRSGPRMLDSLLVVAGETQRHFRYGIGLDIAHPMQQALDLLQPVVSVAQAARPAGPNTTNWLFHVDAKNVVATHWSTLRTGEQTDGFCVRLLETEGLSGRVRLRALRDVASARHVNFRGETLAELPVAGDSVTIDVAAFEWVEIEARLHS